MFEGKRRTMKARRRRGVLLLSTASLAMAIGLGIASAPEGQASPEPSFHDVMDQAMTVMEQGMKRAPMVGDPDHDFAAMMIPHHQGAVDMAKAELLYGKDPVLRRLAQEIIVTQQQEIDVMRRQLEPGERHPQPTGAQP